tara:strand:+ start:1424 stop:2575 length:1152 start_codon:yes stop_codon:yes gene_type:complete
MNIEANVLQRYADAAVEREAALCCPVSYDPQYLNVIPQEVLDRDYGCGDPSAFVKEGETVLDLGSGGGKICFIASQVVGPNGRVLGVDFNPAMLDLARRSQSQVAEAVGYDNVTFLRGRIQDLTTNVDLVDSDLVEMPICSAGDYLSFVDRLRAASDADPLVASDSVDVIVSNCVLNLVHSADKRILFDEMMRVLKPGGRVAISDIVSDEKVPDHLRADADLWSGCISGAFQERDFIEAFERAGFYGICIEKRDDTPWRVVEGIEFRSVTVTAYKGKEGPCLERNQAVIYPGPWSEVRDDDGHIFQRGVSVAVCDKTFKILTREPYDAQTIAVSPRIDIPLEEAASFECGKMAVRHPRVTKGWEYAETNEERPSACGPDESCC